jgi:hypothetical protein
MNRWAEGNIHHPGKVHPDQSGNSGFIHTYPHHSIVNGFKKEIKRPEKSFNIHRRIEKNN